MESQSSPDVAFQTLELGNKSPKSRMSICTTYILCVFFGLVAGTAPVTVLVACKYYIQNVKFESVLFQAALAPVSTALVTMPTALTVLCIAVMLRRHIAKSLAIKSLYVTFILTLIMLISCAIFSNMCAGNDSLCDSKTNRVIFVGILLGIGTMQSIIVAPLYGYVYASSCKLLSPLAVTYTIVGVGLAPVVYALPSILMQLDAATTAFILAVLVYTCAIHLFLIYAGEVEDDEAERRFMAAVEPKPAAVIGSMAETRQILKHAWQPLLNLFVIDVVSNCVFPSLCWRIRRSPRDMMSETMFSDLVVFVLPNMGSITGNLLQTRFYKPLRRTELAVGIVRAVLLLGTVAVSNFDMDGLERKWTRVLIDDDFVFMVLLTLFYLISGYLTTASYATAAFHSGPRAAPRAAKLGSCASALGTILGLILAATFPYII